MAAHANDEHDGPDPHEEICEHFESFFGKNEMVMHELVSDELHIDVYPIPPADEQPCWTLFTTGMSDQPMNVPPEAADDDEVSDVSLLQFAEVMIRLPEDWPVMSMEDAAANGKYWPIGWLKRAARLPNDTESWLGAGHTVLFSEDEEELESDGFAGILVMPGLGPEDFGMVETSDGRLINIYSIVPLYRDELEYKLEHGLDALLQKMEEAEMTDVVEPGRKSVVSG